MFEPVNQEIKDTLVQQIKEQAKFNCIKSKLKKCLALRKVKRWFIVAKACARLKITSQKRKLLLRNMMTLYKRKAAHRVLNNSFNKFL